MVYVIKSLFHAHGLGKKREYTGSSPPLPPPLFQIYANASTKSLNWSRLVAQDALPQNNLFGGGMQSSPNCLLVCNVSMSGLDSSPSQSQSPSPSPRKRIQTRIWNLVPTRA